MNEKGISRAVDFESKFKPFAIWRGFLKAQQTSSYLVILYELCRNVVYDNDLAKRLPD